VVEGRVCREVPSALLMVAVEERDVMEARVYFEEFVHIGLNDCCKLGQDNQDSTFRGTFSCFVFAVRLWTLCKCWSSTEASTSSGRSALKDVQ
jgi:hypothetical protein